MLYGSNDHDGKISRVLDARVRYIDTGVYYLRIKVETCNNNVLLFLVYKCTAISYGCTLTLVSVRSCYLSVIPFLLELNFNCRCQYVISVALSKRKKDKKQ